MVSTVDQHVKAYYYLVNDSVTKIAPNGPGIVFFDILAARSADGTQYTSHEKRDLMINNKSQRIK